MTPVRRIFVEHFTYVVHELFFFSGSAAVAAGLSNPPTPEGVRRAGPCKRKRVLGNRGLQEGFTTSIRPGAEGVKAHT